MLAGVARAGSRTSLFGGRVLGLSALSKLLVGFAVGLAGGRFLISGTAARALAVFVASLADGLLVPWLASVFTLEVLPQGPARAARPRGARTRWWAACCSRSSSAGCSGVYCERGGVLRIYEDLRDVQNRGWRCCRPGRRPGRRARRAVLEPAGRAGPAFPRARREQPLAAGDARRAARRAARPQGPGAGGQPAPRSTWCSTPSTPKGLDRLASRLAETLGVGEASIRERLARRQPYRAVVLKTDASLGDVAALEARRLELPEVSVEVVPLRSYPLASAAAHALGRVGEITERQLQCPSTRRSPPARSWARPASSTGTTSG